MLGNGSHWASPSCQGQHSIRSSGTGVLLQMGQGQAPHDNHIEEFPEVLLEKHNLPLQHFTTTHSRQWNAIRLQTF